MSVTVAAALKKVAAAVLTDKKAGKAVGGIVLAVILIAHWAASAKRTPRSSKPSSRRIFPSRKSQSCKHLRTRCAPLKAP